MAGAVLWDMDGTLVDSEPLHEEALERALRAQGLAVPATFHAFLLGRDARTIHAWCRDELGLTLGFEDWIALKYRTYFALLHRLRPRGGAIALFQRLRAGGRPQAVVSNSDRMVVTANLDAAGLTAPGLVSVSRNDVREGKPHPEPYLRAAWLLGVEPAGCTVVEDSPTGARAGLAAGMRTLFWPPEPVETPRGAIRIGSIAELEARLAEPAGATAA
jgi:HAD superfamily hydrolase (TIGR01509 family)